MAERVIQSDQTARPAATEPADRRPVGEAPAAPVSGPVLLARIIWYLTGILLVLLAFRFVLALLGANPSNGFANFIYSTSHPFVAPFFGLFNYHLLYGVSRFEIYTLIAMAVYAIIGWGLARLATIGRVYREP